MAERVVRGAGEAAAVSLVQAYRGGNDGSPGWWLHLSYDPAVIECLKAYKHGEQRLWDEEKKRWWIAEDIAEQVAAFMPGLEAHLKQGSLL